MKESKIMKKYCKNCGKEEIGYLSALNEHELCPFCETKEVYKQELNNIANENIKLRYKIYKINQLITDLTNLTKE